MSCPDCGGPLEEIEWAKDYTRKVCENQCHGENSHDAHYCKLCDELLKTEWCWECYSTCDECEQVFKGQEQFCSPACDKAYHAAYKHHNELADYYRYEESKYDSYYGDY